MGKSPSPPISVKDAVYKLQLSLLDGISQESQLIAAGSIISKSDYQDVVIERSIANLCGYPLCPNSLLADHPARKGRYRISLKEHKVYDLKETHMYCSPGCVINSRAFAGSLEDERLSELDSGKVMEVFRLFGELGLREEKEKGGLGKSGDLGFGNLIIQEKTDTVARDVAVEDWIGPSNAIEGYVPQHDRSQSLSSCRKHSEKGSKLKQAGSEEDEGTVGNETGFTSAIIITDQSSTSKASSARKKNTPDARIKNSRGEVSVEKTAASNETLLKSPLKSSGGKALTETDFTSTIIVEDQPGTPKASPASKKKSSNRRVKNSQGEVSVEKIAVSNETLLKSPLKSSGGMPLTGTGFTSTTIVEDQSGTLKSSPASKESIFDTTVKKSQGEVSIEKTGDSNKTQLKSALKSSGAKSLNCSVTWADENVGGGDLCDIQEIEDKSASLGSSGVSDVEDVKSSLRFASAEACAIALSEASEAVASGESDVLDAVSEAGIVILPYPRDGDEGNSPEDVDVPESERGHVKWPRKPVFLDSDVIDSEDSWSDTPPEGFSLTLSAFATMWSALFGWVSASSLAYIYGRDESSQDEFLYVDGREYPCKIVLSDGRSSEIKQTLSGCIARALPAVVTNLRLPTPISTLEQALVRLLDTMSFVDALPPFKTKQWHVIVLLFIDALSVRRLPALPQHMASKRMLLHKVLDAAQVSGEEYEVMKGLLIPLGRLPEFSVQSGG
ncbi:putative RNA polymerase II subunit B1 CTD phosphatase RPAP2 homolog [Magnolia sinica]|uniref:putative RNA polymerase II subunit B1 CTD phosphatase RPAP2 homolog n=1 Tax=Magnolia sinica TaxID=86752 RepID=UPI002659475F|nr:putative RNA polymerase II subunit B1 CTD phosphatase RPAP2 homolog [Magnolia sinica]XP_058082037.1 putative RNA polymerase II subunit B1 CTD phosphatase RPAP2 homolog [Magnolia sinica]